MSIKADFHLHSSFSGDSEADMEEMIKKAISLGLTDMSFTEHMDLDFPVTDECPEGMFTLDIDSYLASLKPLREKYADRVKIRFGMELGLQPQIAGLNKKTALGHDFDFIIGSIHVVNHMDIYDPVYFEGKTDEEAYREYFEDAYRNICAFDDYDVVGHLDYVVRKGRTLDKFYSYDKYSDILDKILSHIIEKGKGIELNTGAVQYGLRELNPCTDILRRYRELGGEIITVGSDAHSPENVGRAFDRAEEVLRTAGFTYYNVFDAHVPRVYRFA